MWKSGTGSFESLCLKEAKAKRQGSSHKAVLDSLILGYKGARWQSLTTISLLIGRGETRQLINAVYEENVIVICFPLQDKVSPFSHLVNLLSINRRPVPFIAIKAFVHTPIAVCDHCLKLWLWHFIGYHHYLWRFKDKWCSRHTWENRAIQRQSSMINCFHMLFQENDTPIPHQKLMTPAESRMGTTSIC